MRARRVPSQGEQAGLCSTSRLSADVAAGPRFGWDTRPREQDGNAVVQVTPVAPRFNPILANGSKGERGCWAVRSACATPVGGRPLARLVLDALVAQRAQIHVSHQVLAAAEQHGPDGQVELVDEPSTQILPGRRYATAQAHIIARGDFVGLSQRGLDPVRDEVKHCAAFHGQRGTRVVGQDEHVTNTRVW